MSNEKSAAEVSAKTLPSALERIEELKQRAQGKRFAVFLDYDGTLTPIVARPELAVLSDQTRKTVIELAGRCTVAVISGRDLRDVQKLIGIDGIFYAGSHGFDIEGPEGKVQGAQQGNDFLPALDRAEQELRDRLSRIAGSLIERKKFSIAIHYRQVQENEAGAVEEAVDKVLALHPELRKTYGKKVYELQPKIDWHKGKALLWLLEALHLPESEVLPMYIGDDVTDEDAFRALLDRGVGIVVRDTPRQTVARYALEDTDDVRRFLHALTSILDGGKR
ncbi:MAG: trehalose-phosphatase [Acidobacteria bacterium]|nr:trehalose-phosphatase [Acidobacteriota bacterium]